MTSVWLWLGTLVFMACCALVVRYVSNKSVAIAATVATTLCGLVMSFYLPPTEVAWTLVTEMWLVSMAIAWLGRELPTQNKSSARQ
jgi:hypothetical protein